MEVWAPGVPPSASTDRSTVASESPIVNDAELTVSPDMVEEPLIDSASASADTLSSAVDSVKVPDPDDDPAAITTSKVSPPAGMV